MASLFDVPSYPASSCLVAVAMGCAPVFLALVLGGCSSSGNSGSTGGVDSGELDAPNEAVADQDAPEASGDAQDAGDGLEPDTGSDATMGADGGDATFDAPSEANSGGDATQSTDGAGADASTSDATGSHADAMSEAGSDASAGDAGAMEGTLCTVCSTGQKMNRFGNCVSTSDPYWGCAGWNIDVCSVPNAVAACDSTGACAIGSCLPGWSDCNGLASDGCETDLSASTSCGACNTVCSAGQVCTSSGCASSCSFPDTSCSGSCADLTSSPKHCGSCGKTCPGAANGAPTCANAVCGVQCNAGYVNCYGACRDVMNDPLACGSGCSNCTLTPPAVGTCVGGACGVTCPFGLVQCGTSCVMVDTDSANCGACGHACPSGQLCDLGGCVAQSSLVLATTGYTTQGSYEVIVDGANIYYTDPATSSVLRVPLAGGQATTLATGQANPWRLAADGTYVYWSSNLGGAIVRTLEDGTGAPEVVSSANQPAAIAVDSTYVYWVDDGTASFLRAPKVGIDGGLPTSLGTICIAQGGPPEIAVANGVAYVAGEGPCGAASEFAWQVALPNGPLLAIYPPTSGSGVSATSSTVFTSNGNGYFGWFDINNPDNYGVTPGTAGGVWGTYAATSNSCAAFVASHYALYAWPHSGLTQFNPLVPLTPVGMGDYLVEPPVRMAVAGNALVYSFANSLTMQAGVARLRLPP